MARIRSTWLVKKMDPPMEYFYLIVMQLVSMRYQTSSQEKD